jgi:hypothetical protein
MAAEKYTLNFTDTTQKAINLLESSGFRVCDVLNAGIILFEQANKVQRSIALIEALSNQKVELDAALSQLKTIVADIRVELLSPEESQKVAKIRQLLSDSEDCSEAQLHNVVDAAAVISLKDSRDKKHHNPVILRKSQ